MNFNKMLKKKHTKLMEGKREKCAMESNELGTHKIQSGKIKNNETAKHNEGKKLLHLLLFHSLSASIHVCLFFLCRVHCNGKVMSLFSKLTLP